MPEAREKPRPMMGSPACFVTNDRWGKLPEKRNHTLAPQLLAQHSSLARIHPMHLKNAFGRIHANADNLFHGRLLCLRSSTTSIWHIDAVGGRPPQHRDNGSVGPGSPPDYVRGRPG